MEMSQDQVACCKLCIGYEATLARVCVSPPSFYFLSVSLSISMAYRVSAVFRYLRSVTQYNSQEPAESELLLNPNEMCCSTFFF